VKLEELPKEGLFRRGSGLKQGSSDEMLDGVTVGDLDGRARRRFNIPDSVNGALVANVDQDSAAASAGLRPGDVIVELNRSPVANADEAIRLSRSIEGDTVLLLVWSPGGSHYVVVRTRPQ